MQITTKLHTVYILVGPTMCGKSTFAEAFAAALEFQLARQGLYHFSKVALIGSDDERRNLLSGSTAHRHSPAMMEVSEGAFNVLMAKYKAAISFPVNSEFVIIDTTGMNDTFRKEIRKIAEQHEYRTELVTFEYTNHQYYSQSNLEEKRIVESSAKRFKQEVLPNLGRKDHDGVIRVKQRDPKYWRDLEVEIEELELYAKTQLYLGKDQRINIIGDVHEHTEALATMLDRLGTDGTSILVGDYIDKGNNTAETIAAVERFVDAGGIVVHGNHESYAVKRIKGLIKNPDLELEAKYMSSLEVLLKDEALAARLVDLFDNKSVPFLKIFGDEIRTVYVTHAPCEQKYLGKMSNDALKAQRNLFGARDADYRKAYEFIFKEAVANFPLHVFGHVAHNGKLDYRNKIFLDTGAVYGGLLSAFCYVGNRYWYEQIKCEPKVDHSRELFVHLTTPIAAPARPFSIYDYKLSPEDMKFLNRTLKSGIKYISGTMAPAPSTATEIESLSAGLKYFREKGVKEVILEPKYMGSRCQMYLFRNEREKCFLVSRNGFKIRMTEKLTAMLDQEYQKWMNEDFWDEELILDGELLPWRTLGEHLIEDQFRSYGALVQEELETLAADPALMELDWKQKPDLPTLQADLAVFKETLDIYAVEEDPYYQPFSVLKVDGSVSDVAALSESFNMVNGDEALYVNLDNEEELKLAQEFYDKTTVLEKMEGIVIKPIIDPALENLVAPYMKVRNENYLTLVYGYDYKRRYSALCQQKRVGGKLKVSIKEHELATKMLSADNGPALTELVVKMIAQLNQEKEMDPRL